MSEAKLFSPEGQARMDSWREQVERVQQQGHNVSAWEQKFIQSVEEQLDQGRPLTDRQSAVLDKIESERTP